MAAEVARVLVHHAAAVLLVCAAETHLHDLAECFGAVNLGLETPHMPHHTRATRTTYRFRYAVAFLACYSSTYALPDLKIRSAKVLHASHRFSFLPPDGKLFTLPERFGAGDALNHLVGVRTSAAVEVVGA